ncbi:hypothetical protein ACTRXD_11845 [Nitrospira sp. T9]|uniref:hypothetical protein n=1 Tax=unclassified Nitrospira TaxID=2652172 RepID=UPI003F968D6A
MKKRILGTVISFFVLGGFVAGPRGQVLIGATATAASCADSASVEMCIVINKNGKVDIVVGKDKKLRKPKQRNKPEEPADPVKVPEDQPKSELPEPIKNSEEYDKYGDQFKKHEIIVYAGKTCMVYNGVWYCW